MAQSKTGGSAVVLGGSMAGLLAARIASERFERVTIVERDPFADTPASRKGVGQDRHAHALLARGEQILSRLFPGITDNLVSAGAFRGDLGSSSLWFQAGGYKKQHVWGRNVYTQSRPLLEWHVRRCVSCLPNVQILSGTSIKSLVTEGSRVTGVRVQQGTSESMVAGDLTIDCTGRGSATPRWLDQMGFDKPEECSIHVNIGYATRYYRREPGVADGCRIILVHPKSPVERRAASLLPVEGDRWICTLAGWLGDFPPNDAEGFLAFAKSLPAPDVYNVISQAEPLSDPVPYRFPANLRRYYEKLRRFPERYLVLGDAVCSFNPVYGQGMTSAAQQAEALGEALNGGRAPDLAKRYFRAVARVVDVPWALATGEDLRYPEVDGKRKLGSRLIDSYVSLVHRAVMRDSRVYSDFLRVLNLLDAPALLFHPANVLRVIRANLYS